MADDSREHLVSYDIRDPSRWRRVYRLLNGYGRRIQYSVFRVHGTKLQIARLRWELERILDDKDDLMIIALCPRCAEAVHQRGDKVSWADEDPPFEIVG